MRRSIVLVAALALLLAPALLEPAAAEASPYSQTVHVVKPGDTLYSIARYYGVDAAAIAHANGIVNPDYIYIGQSLVIPGSHMPPPSPGHPPPAGCYTVQHGDTLYGIAWRFGTSVSAIVSANGLMNPDHIYVGQCLVIPGHHPTPPGPGPGPWPPHPTPPSCGHHYTVARGDTLSGIAYRHGTTVHALARANGLKYPYIIYPGQQIYVPCGHHGKPPGHKPPGHRPKPEPPLEPAACHRSVQIVRPYEDQTVGGVVQIIGTATIPDFQFYKLEYAPGHTPLATEFASINEVHTTPVSDSVLGTWFTGNMPTGAYTLRLTAVDNQGQFPAPCDVHIHIDP
jgi:LysM repeat protein